MTTDKPAIKVSDDGKFLLIAMPIIRQPSSTGRTLLVAKTAGPYHSETMIDGKNVTLNLSAWIAKD